MSTVSRRRLTLAGLAATATAGLPWQARAALAPGAPAPKFTTTAARGGQAFDFSLADMLAKGPVVLYFFPKAFTQGCTIEAHEFAEATPRFQTLGATVVGISHDDIETLKRFSVEACRDKFAVASDPEAKVIRAYDAQAAARPGMADRISYVIARQGTIDFAHRGSDPHEHVVLTMKAVERLAAGTAR